MNHFFTAFRYCPHGSALVSLKQNSDQKLLKNGIEIVDITKNKANEGIFKMDGIRIMYSNNILTKEIIIHDTSSHSNT